MITTYNLWISLEQQNSGFSNEKLPVVVFE